MYRGKQKTFLFFCENMEREKFQSALFSPPGRYTGNNFLFKGGLSADVQRVTVIYIHGIGVLVG